MLCCEHRLQPIEARIMRSRKDQRLVDGDRDSLHCPVPVKPIAQLQVQWNLPTNHAHNLALGIKRKELPTVADWGQVDLESLEGLLLICDCFFASTLHLHLPSDNAEPHSQPHAPGSFWMKGAQRATGGEGVASQSPR